MKKILSAILIISIISALLLPANVSAYGNKVTAGYLTFTECDTYCEVSECDRSASGVITIPETVSYNGKSLPVTGIGSFSFTYCTGIVGVTIPDSVTEIGDSAFAECSSLESVTIPESVNFVGIGVFSECSSLTSIDVDAENERYASYEGVLVCNDPYSSQILLSCPGAKSGDYTVPDCITAIAGDAFRGCGELTSVTIPDSVTSIGSSAFFKCRSLKSFAVSNNNNYYTSFEGVLFNKDKTKLIAYPNEEASVYTVPKGVTSIGDWAFCGGDRLTSVTIPGSVTEIGEFAFYECTSLTSAIIPNGVTRINFGAFENCRSLRSVTIPVGVTSIDSFAFDCSDSLETVYYKGSREQWDKIIIDSNGNEPLKNAEIIFNCTAPEDTEPEVTGPEDSKSGDMNGDGSADNQDVVTLFRYVSKKDVTYNETFDFNGDGEVNNRDVADLFRYVSTARKN